jgi:hypothetical protein
MTIKADGKVGIGTSSPTSELTIFHATDPEINFNINTHGTTGKLLADADGLSIFGAGVTKQLRFFTDATRAMTIDSSQRVGIGTTNPGRKFEVNSGTEDVVITAISSDSGAFIAFEDNATTSDTHVRVGAVGNDLRFDAGNNEKARIDSSGRLLVGTSSSVNVGSTVGAYQQITHSASAMSLAVWRQGGTGTVVIGGTSSGNTGAVGSNTTFGEIRFAGGDSTDLQSIGAAISAAADGSAWTTDDAPTRLVFSTTAAGLSSPTERMTIKNDGNVLINTTSQGAGAGFSTNVAINGADSLMVKSSGQGATSAYPARIWHDAASGDNLFVAFATDASYTGRGNIDYNRSAGQVRYNVTSDRRLKSNIQDSESALNILDQVKVRSYIWTETGYSIPHGFIAQELTEAVPDAVKVGDDGDEVTDAWAVDNAKLVPLLTKALQEALQKIETLEQRLNNAGIA